MVEKENIDRQFKAEALQQPEFQKGAKLPEYDFSSSIFSKDLFSSAPFEQKMSYDKPAYLSEIETVPKYNFDYEAY